jgi:hypothetical protein
MPEIKWSDVKLRIGGEDIGHVGLIDFKSSARDLLSEREVKIEEVFHSNLTIVNYSKSWWTKGDAWRHLLNNPPPSVEISHIGPPSTTNPWRKNHGSVYWSWSAKSTKAKEEVDTMNKSNKYLKDLVVGDRFQDVSGCIRRIVGLSGDHCAAEVKLAAKPELKPTATYTFYDDEVDIDRVFNENPQSQVVKVNGEIWIRKGRSEFVCRKFGFRDDVNTDPRTKEGHKQVILAYTTFEELVDALRKREHFKVEVY